MVRRRGKLCSTVLNSGNKNNNKHSNNMFNFSKKPFKSSGVLSESIFSQEFPEPPSESSDSWATPAMTISSDAEKFFTPIAAGTVVDSSEADTTPSGTLEGLELIAEDDGEARLVRIMSWVEKGYDTLCCGEELSEWTLEDEEAYRGGLEDDPGREKLERWRGVLEDLKKKREREAKREERRERWRVVKKSVDVRRGAGEVLAAQESSKDEVRRSCASDADVVKKGNKLFRVQRRVANVFRKVKRPVQSVIAKERFLID